MKFRAFILIIIIPICAFLNFYPLSAQLKLDRTKKINGLSFVAPPNPITQDHFEPMLQTNANWIAIMPFGFIKSLQNPNVRFNINQQWWGEREVGVTKTVQLAYKNSLQIMLKPQIWVWNGEFTGTIKMESETDWKTLEESYEQFILFYARLASQLKVDLFCIGTELEEFTKSRPSYWNQLIKKIKEVYKGPLTYAANWDEAPDVAFWCALDYIGIDAYYPVSNAITPTITEAKAGWEIHKTAIRDLQKRIDTPILFTEYGYRSLDYAGKEPWKSDRIDGQVNLLAQQNLLQAIHEVFWPEPWFAGGFLWKWYPDATRGGTENNRYTIQNKPATQTVAEHFKNY